jgi:hypothetical protein
MPQYRLRTLLMVLVIGPPVLAILYFGPVVTIWDGRFTLNVQLVNETGRPIVCVDAAVVGSRQDAEAIVANPTMEGGWFWKPANLDAAGVAQVDVRCSGHVNWFGREISYYQEPAIAFKVVFEDGTESRFAVDTPRERGLVRNLVANVPSSD